MEWTNLHQNFRTDKQMKGLVNLVHHFAIPQWMCHSNQFLTQNRRAGFPKLIAISHILISE